MYTAEQLERMRDVDIATVDKMSLTDLEAIRVDDAAPYPEKILHFLEQARNPYAFRVGDIPVKVAFTPNAPLLNEILCSHLTTLHAGQ